jgi:hypothetical protein
MNRCLSCSRARIFGLFAEGGAIPKPATTILPYSNRRYFSFDSRNENLPEKRIHQNYVWIAVPVRRVFDGGIGTG